MKEKLVRRMNIVSTDLTNIEIDRANLDMKKNYLLGQRVALQDALDYLKESEKEKVNA